MAASDIAVVFFDLGDTLGTPVLSPPPERLLDFNVFPFALPVLRMVRSCGLRVGVISNTGDIPGTAVNQVLQNVGLLPAFDPDLLIYSKDVGLKKDSPAIFRYAAQIAGAGVPHRCLFVGEDATERGFALDAGWRVAPHPLLVDEVLAGQRLRYVRLAVPTSQETTPWRERLRSRPIVPLHVAGKNGTTVYAVTSQRIVADLINMRFGVELLGEPDAPLRTDLYLLRDDAAAASGFLAPQGESARFFADEQDARLVLSGTAEGLVVALPPERSLEEFHFTQARHGHTLKLHPDPSLLEPPAPSAWVRESALAGPIERPTTRDLTAEEITELTKITGQELLDRAERYGGRQPLNPNRDARLASRHTFHAGNAQAVTALAAELQAVGRGKLTVRLIPFTHAGRRLQNIEAELPGTSRELVLVAAHLDSTAAFSDPYNAEQDSAPGVDDDASGMAAVVTIAERFAVLASPISRS
jgi:bacterial leucyl aminopeptidase